MSEITVYYCTISNIYNLLPRLLAKTLDRNWRAIIEFRDADLMAKIDSHLWSYSDDAFLAHGLAGGDYDSMQPILLTTDKHNTNNAEVRFFVAGAVPHSTDQYTRSVIILESRAEYQAIRDKLVTLATASLACWCQDQYGKWQSISLNGLEKTLTDATIKS